MKKLLSLHKIDTGYLIEVMDNESKLHYKAFHDDIVRDEYLKMLTEVIKVLGMKNDFEVRSKRLEDQ